MNPFYRVALMTTARLLPRRQVTGRARHPGERQ
jgi:hypothetical protein